MGLDIAEVNASLNALASEPKGSQDLPQKVLEEAKKKAMRKIAQLIDLPALESSTTIAVTVDTVAYTLTVSGSELDRIRVINYQGSDNFNQNLSEVDDRSFEIAYQTQKLSGHPDSFTMWGNQIKIYPIPNVAGTLYIDFLKKITGITQIEDEYFSLFIDLCKLEIYEEGSPKWILVQREVVKQLERKRLQIEVTRTFEEPTSYRAARIKDLNFL